MASVGGFPVRNGVKEVWTVSVVRENEILPLMDGEVYIRTSPGESVNKNQSDVISFGIIRTSAELSSGALN